MKLSTSRLLQILLTLSHVATLLAPQIPPKYKPFVMTGIGVLQVLINELSGNSNPDGTPAAQPYTPPVNGVPK
jgi:hypothetical protein